MHKQRAGQKYSIIGGARSGIAVAKLLKSHGAEVFLSDKASAEKMKSAIAELKELNIAHEFGGNTEKILSADVLVLSPGVPHDVAIVKQAFSKGLRVVSEIEVASWFCRAPIVAITGTNGKTTTTTLLGRIFEDAKKPNVVAGNIGLAFSQVVDQMTEQHAAILEVSSFQLDTIESFRPRVSVLLNITPDHLDRYEHSMDKYLASKCRVFENQDNGDTIIYNYDDELVRTSVENRVRASVKKAPFSTTKKLDQGAYVDGGKVWTALDGHTTEVVEVSDISIKGQHNLMNAMAATLAAKAMNVPTGSLRATLKNFKGVEHRLEFVRELDGVAYVNDSKATNVDSVWYALQSFPKPIVVLLGGRDKGNDYSQLYPLVNKHVKAIVAIGESADKVLDAFSRMKPTSKALNMAEAIQQAKSFAANGDVVLLSPACASFDWFDNYEHRGRVFKGLVMKLQ
jgi:UDP-N-acetylmuramoylalanine--D-glutamate ligase